MAAEPGKKPLIALGKIPSVDLIREFLGLNTAPVSVKNAFRDITVEWRKTNTTSNSRPATDLLDWHSPAVQKDLHTLAENFLAEKGNAERFWSASRPWKYDSKLQYPDDKERIVELLVQLFFKQNRYKKNNATYGSWGHKDPESESSREGSMPQRMASIDTTPDKDTKSHKRPRSETAANAPSPTSNFIDLSRSFGGSPTLPWDHTLPTNKNIYDMSDEEEPTITKRPPSLGSSLSSKHSRTEEIGDANSSKRRAKYGLRARTNARFSDAKYDAEFEELLKELEDEDSSSDEVNPQNPQRAPVAPMINHTALGPSAPLPATRNEAFDSAQNHPKDKPKGQQESGSSHMPPPPRVSKTTPSPRPRKTHKLILRTTNGSFPSSGTSANARTKPGSTATSISSAATNVPQTKASSIPSSSNSNSNSSSSSKDQQQVNVPANAKNALSQPTPFSSSSNSKIGGSFKDAHQGNAPVGPTDTPGEHASSLSQPYSRPGGLQQDAQSNFPSAVAHILNIQQTSTAGHVERANFPPVSRPETALLETSHPEPGFNGKSKALSLENFISKPRPKPQVNFLIVMREPRDTTMFWPEGQIQGTSLSSFFAGVAKATQRGGIEKLELTLKTATSDTKVPVAKDDEDSWLVAKSLFAEKLKAARMKAKSKGVNENANSQIYIEPFYGQIGSVDGVQEEDEEDDEEISF